MCLLRLLKHCVVLLQVTTQCRLHTAVLQPARAYAKQALSRKILSIDSFYLDICKQDKVPIHLAFILKSFRKTCWWVPFWSRPCRPIYICQRPRWRDFMTWSHNSGSLSKKSWLRTLLSIQVSLYILQLIYRVITQDTPTFVRPDRFAALDEGCFERYLSYFIHDTAWSLLI